MNLKKLIDFSRVVSENEMKGDDQEDTIELKNMLGEAKTYIQSFDWCLSVEEAYLGIGLPGIIAIFLFNIRPSRSEIDEWLWIVVGDMPPAYLSVIDSPNPASALDSYIGAMEDWVKAVREGDSVDHLIPVNVPPELEWANKLDSRIKFLDEKILQKHK